MINTGLGGSVSQFLEVPNRQYMKNKSKHRSPWGTSLRILPWDKQDDEPTLTEKLISSTVTEWYEAKHRDPSEEEIKLINNIEISECPACGSTSLKKAGYNHEGIQRYKCKDCNVRFTALTNTIFQDRKIPISEWIEYLMHLFEFHSIATSARDNRNASTTGTYWLHKVFAVLEDIQKHVVLEENVYIDEMFFPVIKSKTVLKDGKKLRGISRNKICVGCGYDDKGHVLLIVENTSKPSDRSTWKAYGTHIKPKSTLHHDGERSHGILINKLKLTSIVHTTEETKGLKDEDNPLDPINDLHGLAKRFMREHGGYDRSNLQGWMNLIWFILSEPYNRFEKIRNFIEIAICTHKVVKYRDVFRKKGRRNRKKQVPSAN